MNLMNKIQDVSLRISDDPNHFLVVIFTMINQNFKSFHS